MKIKASVVGVIAVAAIVLAGCETFRWSGHYKHSDAYPQLHHDWQKQPDFPSTSNSSGAKPPFTVFPTSAEEHRQAAAQYRLLIAQYREQAAIHQAMEESYKMTSRSIAVHCERLVRDLQNAAQEMEKLAEWHDAQANGGNK